MLAVEFENVHFSWDKEPVLNGLSLSVEEGEVFALLGRSGCGKSTSLRLISGLSTPTRGAVKVYGRMATDYGRGERRVTTVWQGRALFPHMTARRNIEFGLHRAGVGAEERRARVDDVTKRLDLGELMGRSSGDLSGGEQQRVALARALVTRPDVLLLDEPFVGLDHLMKADLQSDLRNLISGGRGTYILVSHDIDDVMSLADRIAVLHEGKAVQIASPEHLTKFPETPFVAKFAGRLNLIPATSRGASLGPDLISVDAGCGSVWYGENRQDVSSGERVFYALHPESIQIGGEGDCRTEATFEAGERLGIVDSLYFRLACGAEVRVLRHHSDGNGPQQFARGQRVSLTWSSGHAFVLRSVGDDILK